MRRQIARWSQAYAPVLLAQNGVTTRFVKLKDAAALVLIAADAHEQDIPFR
jgi:hypothetical protein